MSEVLAANLHVESHGILVGVDLHHTHLGAVLADVQCEVDQTELVFLDKGTEFLGVLLELLEFALLYGMRADKDERFCHHASIPTLPSGAVAAIIARATRMARLRRNLLPSGVNRTILMVPALLNL